MTRKEARQNATKGNVTGKVSGSVSNVYDIDVKNPIPIDYDGNLFYALNGKQYIPFLNPKDNFGQLLIEAKLLSPTTLSVVGSKADYCAGHGWHVADLDATKPDAKHKELIDWAASVNRKNESLNDIIRAGFDHKFTTGNAFVEVVRGEIGKKRFVRLFLRSILDCRLTPPDGDDIVNSVLFSKQFRKAGWTFDASQVCEIPLYTNNILDRPWWRDERGFQHTMFHIKHDTAGYEYYGIPSNVGSLPQQIMEYKAARYNLDNYDNNLVIGGVVVLKGALTEAERKKIGRDMVYTHTGDGKRGRWVILASESGNLESADIKSFEKQMEGSYLELDEHTEEKIFVSNQWNKLLVGGSEKKSIGQGNSAYIKSVFEIANNTVIVPEQTKMLEKVIKPILRICDEWMGTSWSEYNIGIRQMSPVSFLADIDANAILTKDEGRAIIGRPPLDNGTGDQFIKDSGKGQDPAKKEVPSV